MITVLIKMIKPATIFIFFIICTNLSAQISNNDIEFEHITIKEGLSHTKIFCIFQDSDGFMWFGTDDGLNRYDGYEFKIFYHNKKDSTSILSNRIRSIIEDESGDIWIGTGRGLNKYNKDTENFIQYYGNSGRPWEKHVEFITAICEDNSGNIWMGTSLSGIIKFNKLSEKFKYFEADQNNPNSLLHNNIRAILYDSHGELWVGTENHGLNRIIFKKSEDEELHFLKYQYDKQRNDCLSNNKIWKIFEDHNGTIWIGTDGGGLNKFNRESETFKHYKNFLDNNTQKGTNRIYEILENEDGTMWLSTNGQGLIKFDPYKETFKQFTHDPNNSKSISSNYVYSTFKDKSGILWISTLATGLNKVNQEMNKIKVYRHVSGGRNTLSENVIFSFYENENGLLWIGTDTGIDILDRNKNIYKYYNNNPGNPNTVTPGAVRVIYKDSDEQIWVGTDKGLNIFHRDKKIFTKFKYDPQNIVPVYPTVVRVIHEDSSGIMWFGTNQGALNKFNKKSKEFKRFVHNKDNPESISPGPVRAMYEDKKGFLWIATSKGLNKFNKNTEKFKVYKNNPKNLNSISANNIYSIFEDSEGLFWIGTYKGLNLLDRKKEIFINYTTKDGLANNIIYCIEEDNNGDLWLSTDYGLTRVQKYKNSIQTSDKPKLIFRNFDMNDGVQGNEFNTGASLINQKGELFFGGMNGLNIFHPDDIRETNQHIPPIVFTDIQLFGNSIKIGETIDGKIILNQSITHTKTINLSHKQQYITIKFSALDYANNEKNEYSYLMSGLSSEWINIGNKREINFNLSPGKYLLKIRGSNNDKLWNNKGASLKIIITPPLYKTIWFRGSLIVLLLLLMYLITRSRMLYIKRKNFELEIHNKELNQQIRERKIAEHEKIKLQNLLSNIINSMPSILISVDSDVKIIQWNSEAEKRTGIQSEKAQGESLLKIFPELGNEVKNIKEIIKNRTPQIKEKVILQNDGIKRYNNIIIYPLTTNGIDGAVIKVDDVTEQIKIAEMMIQSEKMLTVGGLAAGMAHEINNPLAGILQNMQVLQNRLSMNLPKNKIVAEKCGISLEKIREYMDERGLFIMINSVIESGKRAAKIVEDMLCFSRKSEAKFLPYSIVELLDKSIELASKDYNLKKNFDFRKIEIIRDYDIAIQMILCEAGKIQQVFLNILKNGAQAMASIRKPDYTPKFIMRIKSEKEYAIRIEIEDNGNGMFEHIRKRVFEPFFTTKEIGIGTGLGLSVSYFIITENHKGKMIVESVPDHGTKFIIRLPKELEGTT